MIIVAPSALKNYVKDFLKTYEQVNKPDEVTLLLVSKKPFNFSKVCNMGLKMAQESGEDVVLINDDIFLEPDTLTNMVKYRDEGIVGAVLYRPDGTIDHAGCEFHPNGWVHIRDVQEGVREVDGVTFALVMIPNWVIEKLGLLDEQYEFYFEDVDYCKRAEEVGVKRVIPSDVRAMHLVSASEHTGPWRDSLKKFQEKWK